MLLGEGTHKAVQFLFSVLLVAAGCYLFFRFLFGALLPFLIAYLIALALQPLVRALEKHAGIPRKITVLLAVCGMVALLALLCVLLFRRVSSELVGLAEWADSTLTRMQQDPSFAEQLADRITEKLPFESLRHAVGSILRDPSDRLSSLLGSLAERLSASVLPFLASLAAGLPNLLFSVFVVLFAAYYLAVDLKGIHARLSALCPKSMQSKLQEWNALLRGVGSSFFRAYGLILLVTFSELFSALLILGYRYAFLIALITACIDILPVLGTGTVLLPWAAACLLFGNTVNGVGLLITYAIMTVVRQVIEPKIVGKYIGLSPLCALASMYLGLRLIGFWGLFLFPLGALLLTRLWSNNETGEKKETS